MTVGDTREIDKATTMRLPPVGQAAQARAEEEVEQDAAPSASEPPPPPIPEDLRQAEAATESQQPQEARSVDERPTPTYLPAIAAPARSRLGRAARLAVIAALVFSLLALAVAGTLARALQRVGAEASTLLDNTLQNLESVCGDDAEPLTFTFSQTVRFKGEVPLPEGLVFPFKGNIPINTVVRIEVPGFPGSPTLEVPINTSVPIDTKVPVPGGITIPIDTTVPVRQDIPIDLCGSDSPLAGFLGRTVQDLRSLRDLMRFP